MGGSGVTGACDVCGTKKVAVAELRRRVARTCMADIGSRPLSNAADTDAAMSSTESSECKNMSRMRPRSRFFVRLQRGTRR